MVVLDPAICRFCGPAGAIELIDRTNDGLAALASYGAFVPGWTLVVPPRHVSASSALTPAEWDALDSFTRQIQATVEERIGPAVVFEHGAASFNRSAGCGVDHAHLHVVPLDLDLRTAVASLGGEFAHYDWQPCDERPHSVDERDYIWLRDRSGGWVHHTRSQPSQVVRRAIARVLGIEDWDWKSNYRLQVVSETQRLLALDLRESA